MRPSARRESDLPPAGTRGDVCSLEAGRDEVCPVRLCEVERLHGAKEHMPSFGGIEAPGSLWLTQAPSVSVPEYVSEREWSANDMAWMSAREKMGHGPSQTGVAGHVLDGNGEPSERDGVILETAPAPWNAACEVRSLFCERSKRARLRDWEPALKRPVIGTKPPRGRLKWWRLCEFGKHVSPCEHVCRG